MPPDDMGDTARQQLIDLLDGRLDCASAQERARICSEVTSLFLRHADDAHAPTLALFDQIFPRLIDDLNIEALASLSAALAKIDRAPADTVALLAHHGSAAVAAPILSGSKSLTLADLAAVASGSSQDHLLAVCARARIDERLSAIMVARAMQPVIDRLLVNPGARFAIEDFRAALPRATADSRGRVALRQPALILDLAGRLAGRCVTIDISPGGVKLQVGPGAQLSETFTIELTSIGQTHLRCRVAWRQIGTVGIQFTTPLADQLTGHSNRH